MFTYKEVDIFYERSETGDKPVLLVTGGSSGAQKINEVLREALPELMKAYHVFHLCGKGNIDSTLKNLPDYRQEEFLTQELPDVFAMADLVVSRAGSNAISELQALSKPMLLIPYPKAQTSRGDQVINARNFEKRGLAYVLNQEDLTANSLVTAIEHLGQNAKQLLTALAENPASNGTKAVLYLIEAIQKK